MRKFDLSLRSSRSSYFATFRHQLTILSKTDALDEEKWLNMLGTFVKDWFRYESHFVHGRDSLVDILKERGLLSESDAVQPLIGKRGRLATKSNQIKQLIRNGRSASLQRTFKKSFTSFSHSTRNKTRDGLIRVRNIRALNGRFNTSITHAYSIVIGSKHITLNATGGGFLTA